MLGDQSSLHAASAKAAAMAKGVAYIDLTSLSIGWYNTLGSKAAALKFHANGPMPRAPTSRAQGAHSREPPGPRAQTSAERAGAASS